MTGVLIALHRTLRSVLHRDETPTEQREVDDLVALRFRKAAARGSMELFRVTRVEFLDLLLPRERAGGRGWGLDLRAAGRRTLRAPGGALLVIGTLAGSVGAAVTVAEIARALLRETPPWPEVDRVVRMDAADPSRGRSGDTFRVTEWEAFRTIPSLEAVVGSFDQGGTLTRDGDATRVVVRRVTPGWFDFFGAEWAAGRGFQDDDPPNALRAVLSAEAWRRWGGAGAPEVGGTVVLDGTQLVVVGVLTDDFASPHREAADVYLHHGLGTEAWRGRWLTLWGRRATGADVRTVDRALDVRMADLDAASGRPAGWEAVATPVRSSLVAGALPSLRTLAATVVALLLMAVVGAAAVLAGRAWSGLRDVRLRGALGGGRWVAARPVVVESGTLVLLGLGFGAVTAVLLLDAAHGASPVPLSLPGTTGPGDRLTLLWAAVALPVGLLALLPTLLLVARADRSGGALRRAYGRAPTGMGALVAVQSALALTVLIVGARVAESAAELLAVDPGFRTDGVWSAAVHLPADTRDPVAAWGMVRAALESRPEIEAVGLGSDLPLGGGGAWGRAWSEQGQAAGEEGHSVLQRVEGPGWFSVLDEDADGRPPPRADGVVISRRLAEALWPGRDPVGERMTVRSRPGPEDWWTVTAIVDDIRFEGLADAGRPQYYRPMEKEPSNALVLVARVRPGGDPRGALRAAVLSAMPGAAVEVHGPLADRVTEALAPVRFAGGALFALGLVAVLLVGAGSWGVAELRARSTRRDTGVRLALGAQPRRILLSAAGAGLRWSVAGLVVGGACAVLGVTAAGRIVPDMQPSDSVLPWIVPAAFLLMLSLGATLGPARRAAALDPLETLREE